MPLQNRVTPEGEIIAHPARGLLMGNRGGKIHRPDRTLGTRRWASRQWISCVLEFKNRQRQVMGDSYTELFFLDEITALAAGHRPCFECQRARARAFAAAFPGPDRAPQIDRVLHSERLGGSHRAEAGSLPDGAMIQLGQTAAALRGETALPWTPEGYGTPIPRPTGACELLTPPTICAALSAGYVPVWHPSARGSG